MYMCICKYTYLYVYVHTSVCIQLYVALASSVARGTCIHIHLRAVRVHAIYVNMYTCMHIYRHVCILTHYIRVVALRAVRVYVYMYVYTSIRIRICL